MFDELKTMGVEILSSRSEVCANPCANITLVLSLIVSIAAIAAIIKIISEGMTFFSTVDIAGVVILIIIFIGSLVYFFSAITHPPKVETGRTLFELYINDPETYGEIVQKYEVVDCSKFPIVTIAISPNDWLRISQWSQFPSTLK